MLARPDEERVAHMAVEDAHEGWSNVSLLLVLSPGSLKKVTGTTFLNTIIPSIVTTALL